MILLEFFSNNKNVMKIIYDKHYNLLPSRVSRIKILKFTRKNNSINIIYYVYVYFLILTR